MNKASIDRSAQEVIERQWAVLQAWHLMQTPADNRCSSGEAEAAIEPDLQEDDDQAAVDRVSSL